MDKFLITGVNGFVGSHMAELLLKKQKKSMLQKDGIYLI